MSSNNWNNQEKTGFEKLNNTGGDQTVADNNSSEMGMLLNAISGKNKKNAEDAFGLADVVVNNKPGAKETTGGNEIDKNNLLRMVKLTDYENDRYKTHKETMYIFFIFCVIFAIILYIFQAYALPYLNLVLGVLGAIMIIILLTRFWDAFTRDRFNYDKYDFSYDMKFMQGKYGNKKNPRVIGSLPGDVCGVGAAASAATAAAASSGAAAASSGAAAASSGAAASATDGNWSSIFNSLDVDSVEFKVGDATITNCIFNNSTEMESCGLEGGQGWKRKVGCQMTGGAAESGGGTASNFNPCTLCSSTPAKLCELTGVKDKCGDQCGSALSGAGKDLAGKLSFKDWVKNTLMKPFEDNKNKTATEWETWWKEDKNLGTSVTPSTIDLDKLGGDCQGCSEFDKYNIIYTLFYKILNNNSDTNEEYITDISMPEILRPKEGQASDYMATCNYACNPKSTAGSNSYYKSSENFPVTPSDNKCYSSVSVNNGTPSSCEVAWDLQANNIKCKCKTLITDAITPAMFGKWAVEYAKTL